MRTKSFFLIAWMILLASLLHGQTFTHTMRRVERYPWLSIWGGWDAKGVPFIRDVQCVSRYTALADLISSPHQIELTYLSGAKAQYGITKATSSEGGDEAWSAYVCIREPFVSYRIASPGKSDKPGRLDCPGKEAPRLVLQVDKDGRLSWEIKPGCRVQVDVSLDEGESWMPLGNTNAGSTDIKPHLDKGPVIRFQAYRGLMAYVEFYMPGEGILKDPWLYLQQTTFLATHRGQGSMSSYPEIKIGPFISFGTEEQRAGSLGYRAKMKFCVNWKRLPFRVEEIFKGKIIQKVFQAEWNDVWKSWWGFSINEHFFLHRDKQLGLALHYVTPDGKGGWKTTKLGDLLLGRPPLPNDASYSWDDEKHRSDVPTFKDYFVLTAEP